MQIIFNLIVVFVLTNMSRIVTSSDVQNQIREAFNFHKAGQWREAIYKYEAVIPYVSGNMAVTICSNAGAAHMQLGDFEAAAAKFKIAVDAAPENAEPHFNLAVVYNSKLGKNAQAIKHCGLAIKLDPAMHKAYHLMGNILQDIGKPEDAVRYFTMAESIAGGGTTVPESADEKDSSTCQSSLDKFSKLWVWGAKINTTYYFRRVSSASEWEMLSSDLTGEPSLGGEEETMALTCLSERPLIFDVPLLLTTEECQHIIATATPLLERSHVMGKEAAAISDYDLNSGDQDKVLSNEPFRSSYNAWLPRDSILSELQLRVSALTGLPHSYVQLKSEELQVVKYDSNGQFQLHQDSSQFHPRMLTALVYLQDAAVSLDGEAVGGETWFPFAPGDANREFSPADTAESLSFLQTETSAGRISNGLKVAPLSGRAVIFFNHRPDGSIDHTALHSGRKVHSGMKWIANYWIKLDQMFLNDSVN